MTVYHEFAISDAMDKNLRALSKKRMIDMEVLHRLALYDFLVKFNGYNEQEDILEKEEYDRLYKHFATDVTARIEAARSKPTEFRI